MRRQDRSPGDGRPADLSADRAEQDADRDRRAIRRILVLVSVGWLLAVALMGVAALFWDRG